ncbi:hypothetical protein Glove_37g123 [Diversispora epigaea]|uniref:BTB domain-containing protein n=1 Tax=Diversispora epigaea TaxID=1348612 RepID=A0A397JG03_9GLOM|nr:hypothetical protein Glove_37g123 [Diversispora epigaea]
MTTKFYDRLSNDLTQLLENPFDCNVTIEVGEEPASQIFEAHSYILQSRSPYFKKKFNESPFNENHELKMPDISTKVFNVIINYIYGGTISLEKLENSIVFDLLIASHELDLDELVEHLQNHLVTNNSSWLRLNFAHVYQTSFQKNFEIIQKFCNNIIVKHPETVLESENFNFLPEDVLISIIRLDNLQLEEDKIWDYVIQWGMAKNPNLPANLDEWTSDNFLTLKTTLKNCLPHIRYFNISGELTLKKLYPYQQLFEPKLWLDILTRFLTPNEPISSPILPPRNILNVTLPTRTRTTPIPSNIITDERALEISSWIDRKETPYTENNPYEFKLLVRGSKDGFDVKTILKFCDKVSNTVIVLKVKGTGEIIGGYNPLEIYNNMYGQWYSSENSFAFSLKTKNQENSIVSRVTNFNYAIYYNSSDSYFQFGRILCLRGNLKTGKGSICSTEYYEKQIRSNTSVFSVEEFEVFKVSPKK